jgi:hypothetical protein
MDRLKLFTAWFLATLIGTIIESVGISLIGQWTWCLLMAAVFVLLGALQWLVLKNKFGISAWWIAVTFAAHILVVITCFSIPFILLTPDFPLTDVQPTRDQYNSLIWVLVIAVMDIGFCFGLCQWFILRSRLEKAYWWIAANILGWGIGMGLLYVIFLGSLSTSSQNMPMPDFLLAICVGAPIGLCWGLATGITLIYLPVKKPKPKALPAASPVEGASPKIQP